MTVLDNILKLLNENSVSFDKFEHKPVYTSEEAANIRGLDLSTGAKALVCFADKQPVLIVIPGDKKLDFKKFKESFRIKDIRMATPEEVKTITTLEIGSIPPFGSLMGIRSFYDNSINNKDTVAFNAGAHTVSVIMKAKDLILLEHPQFGAIVR